MAKPIIRLTTYGADSRATLLELIGRAKQGDPLVPVTVAVPNNYAGLTLRRALASSSLQGGLVNVRFMVLARVIELIGAPRLAALGRRPLTFPYRAEAVRAVVEANPGPFAGIALLGSTERSLQSTFRNLTDASDDALEKFARLNRRSAHVVALYRDFRERTSRFYDQHDLALAAGQAIAGGSAALRDIGHTIVYLPRTPGTAERDFVAALGGSSGADVILGLTGDAAVDSALVDAWRPVGTIEEFDGPAAPPRGTAIAAVSDAEEEVREAVRQICGLLRSGVPLHRMAILYRHASPYEQLAAEQLAAANLPWNGPSPGRLGQTTAGRTLLGFLGLHERAFERDAVAGWLNSAPVLDEGAHDPIPAHHWERLARAAGIVSGGGEWQRRLARHACSLESKRRRLEGADEDREWSLRRVDQDIAELDRLRSFIDELVRLAMPSGLRRWSEFASWAQRALNRFLGGEGRTGSWPKEEVTAYREVVEALDQLGDLDEVRDRVDAATFRAAAERLLDRPAGRFGQFGHGLFVGRLADATGQSFEAIFVVGMNEGAVPPREHEDPLVPDAERRMAGLEPRSRQLLDERREYLAALASARRRTLIFPRADMRGQRARLPSRWLLETASELAGDHVSASEMDSHAGRPWFRSVPSFEWSLRQEEEPAQMQEYDLRSLLRWRATGRPAADHFLAVGDPALANGFELQHARRSSLFTRWDGFVPTAARHSPFAGRTVSPTALQTWSECPFRYFLAHLLGISELDRPELELRISHLEEGSLVHRALDRFLRAVPGRTDAEQPWTAEERARMRQIGEEECGRAEESGVSGHTLLWEVDRRRILRDLEGFLDHDEDLRRRLGTVPIASELTFGFDGDEALTVEAGEGRTVRLQGKIDRVDRTVDGSRLVVIDYKAGAVWDIYKKLDDDPVQGGRLLQLPVYAAAARRRYGDATVDSYYWFVTERGAFATCGYELDAVRDQRFISVLETISRGMGDGIFPLRPGPPRKSGPEHCRLCPYSELCPADRSAAWQRKRGAPQIAAYRAMVEPEASR